ncbi:sensor histidine kinase [Actinophytocola xanthii]|nr:sensor histidine kinase [Actinophytocola xanthii]
MRRRLESKWRDMWQALRLLAPTALTGFASLLVSPLVVLTVVLALVAPGRRLPGATALRAWADTERDRLDGPVPVSPDTSLRDPVVRRDLAWFGMHATLGMAVGLLAVVLPLSAVNAAMVPTYWWVVPENDPVVATYPVTSWGLALLNPLVGLIYAALSLYALPPLARWYRALSRRVLIMPADNRLAQRVAELTASRAAALEAHGAELRRIERDLHDGTQNRLVAVAMHLGLVERALRRDPAEALPMVLRAQDAAADALAGLRDVVRSIYPPVLAERGLDGAVAGLIARCPVPCSLTAVGPLRAPAAVESAAYFVVAEALTNIAKHSGATRASVVLSREDDLVIEVHDDGHGGADEESGTGLAGIRRRVAALDGTATITSPPGGPTLLRVELPCGS